MRICSDDGTIELNRGAFADPADFDVSVESRGFSGRVHNIFPLSVGEFLSELGVVERHNEGRAVLRGTEDFELVLIMLKGRGDFWIDIRLCSGFSQPPPARVLHCRLHVDGEHWGTTVAGLRAELVGLPAAAV